MANKTPITSNVVMLLSDAKQRARIVFLADGNICPEREAPVLRLLGDALYEAQEADNARIESIYALNFGLEEPPTYTHARRRRELEQAREFDGAA